MIKKHHHISICWRDNHCNVIEKMVYNALYALKLERSFAQLDAGRGQVHELIASCRGHYEQ